jgi:spore germination protein GerM
MKRLTAIILLLTLCAGLLGCQTQEDHTSCTFYYFRSDPKFSGINGVIAPEQRQLPGGENDLDVLLELYLQGPAHQNLENPLPDNCPVPNWELSDGTLFLSFSQELAQLTGMDLTLAASCLARTFLELTGAETLVLTADGKLLNGEAALVLSRDQLILRDDSMDQLRGEHTVYYTGVDRRYLIGHSVNVNLENREELPGLLLEQMLTVPQDTELRSLIPSGTKIRSVRVEDGLCTVDLSQEFESRRSFSQTGQLLSLMGIVNTLCNLNEIDQVTFLVEGDPLVHYGAFALPDALVLDERFLGPVRTGLGEWDATIYLAHGQQAGLFPVPTRLRQSATASTPVLMMRALLGTSGLNDLDTRISAGTLLNSIQVEDQVCRVDLSEHFLNSPDLVWAVRVIVASLCTIEDISAVQITVDGVIPDGVDSELFGILSPNDSWFL